MIYILNKSFFLGECHHKEMFPMDQKLRRERGFDVTLISKFVIEKVFLNYYGSACHDCPYSTNEL